VEVKIKFDGYLWDFVVRHRNVMININCCGKMIDNSTGPKSKPGLSTFSSLQQPKPIQLGKVNLVSCARGLIVCWICIFH